MNNEISFVYIALIVQVVSLGTNAAWRQTIGQVVSLGQMQQKDKTVKVTYGINVHGLSIKLHIFP